MGSIEEHDISPYVLPGQVSQVCGLSLGISIYVQAWAI